MTSNTIVIEDYKNNISWLNHLKLPLLWFGLTLLFSSPICFGQSSLELKKIIRDSIAPSERIIQAETLLNREKKAQNDSLGYLYNQFAYWLFNYDLPKTIETEKLAMEFTKSQKQIDTFLLQKSAISLGFYYERNDQIKEALKVYKELILLKKPGRYETNCYGKLGYCYGLINDYHSAIDYYKVQISLLEENKNDQRRLMEAYLNTASYLIKLQEKKDLLQAEIYALKADSLAQIIPTRYESAYYIKLCLAQRFNQFVDLNIPKAEFYYNQAFTLADKANDIVGIQKVYYEKGALYNSTDPELSIAYYKKAQELSTGNDPHVDYLITSGLSTSWAYNNHYEKSIFYREKAINELTKIDGSTDQKDSLIITSPYKTNLLNDFAYLGEIQLNQFHVTKDSSLLKKSLQNFERADATIDLLKLDSSEFKSRLFWRRLSASVYDKAIYASFLLKDTEKALYFAEKNKALLLLEDLSQQNFRNATKAPSNFLKEERSLKEQLLLYENKTELNNEVLQKKIIDTKIILSQLQDSMYKEDYRFTLDPSVISLANIQKQLKADEVFIEYHISESDSLGLLKQEAKAYVFMISQDKIISKSLDGYAQMKPKILSLLSSYRAPFKTKDDLMRYQEDSFELFQYLIPTEKFKDNLDEKKLIIAPDNLLSFLPFDALHTNLFEKDSFLLKQCEVQYAYSYSFLKSLSENTPTSNGNYLGIAPGNFKNNYLTPLSHSVTEVKQLDDYFNGSSFTLENATKEVFMTKIKESSIVHLATHADVLEGEMPWIAMYDGKVTLEELYETPNSASLVFLSGCNTSLGKIETGEGVMSLARGFFYSGSQSVISTLWSIDDRSTQEITARFYEHLEQGESTSQALRNAKLAYLENNDLSQKSPHFWASFVLLGESTAMRTENFSKIYIAVILIVIIILVLFFLKNKK